MMMISLVLLKYFDAMMFKICEKLFKMYGIDNKFNLIFLILLFYLDKAKNKMPNKACFHESWLSNSRFMEWIARSNSEENAYCKLCKCVISLSNVDEKALRSHADGKKHKKRLEGHEQVKNFFKAKNAIDITKEPNKTSEPMTITTSVDSVSAASPTSFNASHTKSRDACFQDSAYQKVEIMCALKHVYNELSDNSAKKCCLSLQNYVSR